MTPRTDSRNLPDNMAEYALNCDLSSGALDGLPIPELVHDFSTTAGIIRRAYRLPDPSGGTVDGWLPLPSEFSSVVRSPLTNDTRHRIYWTNPGDTRPHWIPYDNLIAGATPYDLGTIQPVSTALTIGVVGGVATPVTRSYCYTFVNEFGEESAPNLPSADVSGAPDGTWTVTGMPTTRPANSPGVNYPLISGLYLYRTVTGATTGAQFFRVATFEYGTTNPTSPYTDAVTDTQAAENDQPLLTSTWVNPPDNLDGLVALPGGMLVGFTGNTVHFCEPDRPHTWPAAYDQALQYDVVGFGVWQQSLIALTKGFPFTGTGNSPSNFIFTMVRVPEPCIARGSIVTDLMGVYYASQNGLVMLNYFGMQNQTLTLFTKKLWVSDYRATDIVACRHRAQYLAINGTDIGFLIDYSEQRLGVGRTGAVNNVVCVWNDEYTGDTYVIAINKKVYKWDSDSTSSQTFRWRSKQFYHPAPINLGACHISADPSIETATPVVDQPLQSGDNTLTLPDGVNALFRLYAGPDGEHLVHTQYLYKPREIFRLPSGFKAFDWQFEIVSRVPVHSVELATTMKELKGV